MPTTAQPAHILIIEDDFASRSLLVSYFEREGYRISEAEQADDLPGRVSRDGIDLVLLDINLPGKDGLTLTRELRASSTAGIILVTSKGDEIDRIVGLELGADDYVTKPFGVRELLARIQALLRRSAPGGVVLEQDSPFTIGHATINPRTFELKRGKDVETLTAKELKVLQLFHAHPGEVLSRDRLLNEVWGYNYYGTTRTLDQVIVQLRKKLGDNGDSPRYLLTVHGVGYKLAR